MYKHEKQYRCTIIRGKAKSELDDLLPIYGSIVNSVCPSESSTFIEKFNIGLKKYLPDATEKTINNHRSEIVTKLFGMVFFEKNTVFSSERTNLILENQDHPAFFKDFCFKLQFPNGMDSSKTIRQRMDDKICLRPCTFIIKCIHLAKQNNIALSTEEVGYYILNNLYVLRGQASQEEVLDQIIKDRKSGVTRRIEHEGKSSSYSKQHIRELLSYLELANLVKIEQNHIYLNEREKKTINVFLEEQDNDLLFPMYDFENTTPEDLDNIRTSWQCYFGQVAHTGNKVFETVASSFQINNELQINSSDQRVDVVQIGNDGEKLVFEYEKQRVKEYNPRYTDRVRLVGGTKGIGYDVHSILGYGENPNHAIYIEVKSTTRVTKPNRIVDSVTVTRNEWLTAEQQGMSYWIYRVYFTQEGSFLFKFRNPANSESNKVYCEPITYRIDFEGLISELEKVN